eukprot:TRINITY_DN5566_c0_g1_i1.p1 TRINITY_DN5566_c0_g1~~TRINITY_DN5566_c0_g1_i1.p1  ORF type:complete len:255 (+),score=47.99 TRINITY_DN5566_c0_g1_i1:723-1487(+)
MVEFEIRIWPDIFQQLSGCQRGSLAIKRLNAIHGKYRISNDDFLYTLSVFIYEPIRLIEKYGYRTLTDNEKLAIYYWYRNMGIEMGIKHIPSTYESFEFWQQSYERKYMIKKDSEFVDGEHAISKYTINFFLTRVPNFMSGFGRKVIIAMLDDRLREATGYEKQPQFLSDMLDFCLKNISFFVRYFFLPRYKPSKIVSEETEPGVHTLLKADFGIHPDYENGYETGCVGNLEDNVFGDLGEMTEDSLMDILLNF